MKQINSTTEKKFKVKNPKTGSETFFLGSAKQARADYLNWSWANVERDVNQGFFWWCNMNLIIAVK